MYTAAPISIEEYLHSDFQPDREYVDGEIRERNPGELDHSNAQMAVAAFFHALRSRGLYTFPELRVQVRPTRFRVPDITVTIGKPEEQILTKPPFIVVEVLSPDDSLAGMMERVNDYWDFGVRNIWVIDPRTHRAFVASPEGILARDVLRTVGEPSVTMDLTSLFD